MDTFPSLHEQIIWIIVLSILSYFAIKLIKKKQLVQFPEKAVAVVALKDVIVTFGFYLVLSIIIVPFVFSNMRESASRSPIETISLFQLFFMTLVSGFTMSYLKVRKIHLFKKPENYLDVVLKALLYLAVIFPIVSLIGQLCDTFLYLVFDVRGYEQLAVGFLRKTLSSPIALFSSIVSIVILAPLTEELLFRGILLNFFQNRFGSFFAVIISGLLFALFHFSASQGFGNISLLCALSFFGMMLGVFYLMTSSLVYPIMLHAIFNLLSSLRILFIDS